MSATKIPGEFFLINRLQAKLIQPKEKESIIGIGDDCAVLQGTQGNYLLVTTDMLIEDVHFSRLYSSFQQIGQKALIVNISDIAAMGGKPKFAFISLALPPSLSLEDFDELSQGITEIAEKYSISIVGGDTNAGPDYLNSSSKDEPLKRQYSGLVINITLLGEIQPKNIITRRSACQGDLIILTGHVGDSAAGLDLLNFIKNSSANKSTVDFKKNIYQQAIKRHQVPIIRLAESQIISQNHLATAMIDVSDGVAGDLRHICQQSEVGAVLWCEHIPISKAVQDIARLFHKPPLSYGLSGGEDYELLFTCPPDRIDEAKRLIKQGTGTPMSIIGEITQKEKGVRLIDFQGHSILAPESGFDHFQSDNA